MGEPCPRYRRNCKASRLETIVQPDLGSFIRGTSKVPVTPARLSKPVLCPYVYMPLVLPGRYLSSASGRDRKMVPVPDLCSPLPSKWDSNPSRRHASHVQLRSTGRNWRPSSWNHHRIVRRFACTYETLRSFYQPADCAVQASDIPAKQGLRACLWLPGCSQGLPMRAAVVIPRLVLFNYHNQ